MRCPCLCLNKSAGFRLGSKCSEGVYGGAGGALQFAECLPVMHQAMSPIPHHRIKASCGGAHL